MRIFAVAVLALFSAGAALAQQMHTVAVSPDGATIYASGDNRTLYTLDAATLEVTDRRYVPEMVREIQFSPDGRRMYLRMDKEMVRVVSAGSWKLLFEIDDIRAMSLSADGKRLAALDDHYKGGILHLVNARSGKLISRMEFPDVKTKMVALSDDGMTAMMLTQGKQSDTEAKESPPSDLKGFDKALFRQQKDGYTSQVVTVNYSDESHKISETFFRSSFPFQVRMVGDKMAVLNNASDSGFVASDGSVEMLNLGEKYVSNIALNAARDTLMVTNSMEYSEHPLQAGGVAGDMLREVEGPRIDGPGEWATAMTEGPDGTIYMVTNAYRIWKVAPGSTEPEIKIIN